MPVIDHIRLLNYREKMFCLSAVSRIDSPQGALEFVNERGFVFFWPVKQLEFPSLWKAVAGDRSVPDEHDDPGHITWRWKDASLDKRIWYYGKFLMRKATFISLELAPYFYALSDNYGSPEEDYMVSYTDGRLTQAAKQVYEVLLGKGALDTISLRKESHLTNARDSQFNRALEDLQAGFKILPVGIAEAGAWRYAYRYDIITRHFPDLQGKAQKIGEAEARQTILDHFFRSLGAARKSDIAKLFGWAKELLDRTIESMIERGVVVGGLTHPLAGGVWYALPELVES